jgi:sugar-specific transcriptional regulator TrmB
MNIEPLQRIGLTPGEIKVYIALLHIGTTTAGPIAKEARVARSKLYDILDRLSKKGLVSHSVKNGTRIFSVAEPNRFLDFLRKKEENIKKQQQEIKQILPQLEQEYELQKVKQEAEVFEGLEGLKNAREKYLNQMKKGDSIYFFGVPGSAYHRMEAYYSDWNDRRIKKEINSYTVFTNEAKNHDYVKRKLRQKHTFVKFLPKGILTHAWTEIYGDTVVIAINYKKPMSIVINNKYVAESYKQYFDLLWSISK